MKTSRIEQIIDELESYVSNAKPKKFSASKDEVIINKQEIDNYILTLRDVIPDDIKKYHSIANNHEAIINDAKNKAESILKEARDKTTHLISEHEIMQQAVMQANQLVEHSNMEANRILNQANVEANEIKLGAIRYTEEMLQNLGDIITDTVESINGNYQKFINSYKEAYDIIMENKMHLVPVAKKADEADAIAKANDIIEDN